MHDVVIVGAGAAGVAAGLEMVRRDLRPVILDVGHRPGRVGDPVQENFYDFRRHSDTFNLTIGEDLFGLFNLLEGCDLPVKLLAPEMAYLTRDAGNLSPVDAVDFSPIQSFAAGGLANAWGAGLYRFVPKDMEGFPYLAAELDPYADLLTAEIGISGCEDDLTPDFGSPADLLPPLRLSHNMARLLSSYERLRQSFPPGLRLGRPRIGALTEPRDGRPAIDYLNLEFWQQTDALYKPRLTLDRLIAADRVDYRPGVLVQSWSETEDTVAITYRRLDGGGVEQVHAKRLLLAAGAIGTTRIVLGSAADYDTNLPLLENPALQIPLLIPASIGRGLDVGSFGLVQLNLIWDAAGYGKRLQGSLLEVTSPSRAELFANFPLAARANLTMIRTLLPAMIVLQLFWPGEAQTPARLGLRADENLRITGEPNRLDMGGLGPLLGALRRLGALTHPALIVRVPTGHAIHYAGTLPMRQEPGRYECDPTGRLHGTKRVFIADSAAFPNLPAKNMSFAMMCHAMRTASMALEDR